MTLCSARSIAGSVRNQYPSSSKWRISPSPSLLSGECSQLATSSAAQINQNQSTLGQYILARPRVIATRRAIAAIARKNLVAASEGGTAHKDRPSANVSIRRSRIKECEGARGDGSASTD